MKWKNTEISNVELIFASIKSKGANITVNICPFRIQLGWAGGGLVKPLLDEVCGLEPQGFLESVLRQWPLKSNKSFFSNVAIHKLPVCHVKGFHGVFILLLHQDQHNEYQYKGLANEKNTFFNRYMVS